MSDPILTTREMGEFRAAVEVLIGYYQGLGMKPCFALFTEATSWNRTLYVCACQFPYYEVSASPH